MKKSKKNGLIEEKLFFLQELISLLDDQINLIDKLFVNSEYSEKDETNISLKWTGSSFEFVELSKALYLSKSFNNGDISFKDMFDNLCRNFDVSINNPYAAYTKMKDRVENRTIFLTKLIESVEKDMDDKDNQ